MKSFFLVAVLTTCAFGEVTIPEGTKIRVRLDQTISSATADQGQTVELSVTENVKVGGMAVIPEGSRVTGTITEARAKRRMGRSGKLDFSIDRVRAQDGEWVPLRYTLNKRQGESHSVRTGVLTAGAAVVFWPAAPVFLLMHGKDITINKGVTFDVFTDGNHVLSSGPKNEPAIVTQAPAAAAPSASPAPASGGTATVAVTSSAPGADIEVDGAFAGSTPTTLQMSAGVHHIVIKSGTQIWERKLLVTTGSTISLNAVFPAAAALPVASSSYRNGK
jgi:hypothetical protein